MKIILRWVGALLFAAGILGLVLSALLGDLQFHLILVIPVISGSGPLPAVSILSLIAGPILIFLSPFLDLSEKGGSRVKSRGVEGGGIVFIGPIPIIFGSRRARGMLPRWWILLLIGVIFYIVLLLLSLTVPFFSLAG